MQKISKVAAVLTAFAATTALAGAAHAEDNYNGKFQFKVLATNVMPSGSLSTVTDPHGLTATNGPLYGLNTTANDNVTPTIAVEYFVKPNISIETIAGVSSHHVSSPALGGVGLVDHAQVIPFTLTAKYHFVGLLPAGIKPYIGAGPTLFAWINDRPSAALQSSFGITRTKLSSDVGAVVQAGVDVPVGHGYSLSLDAKKYFVNTNAHFYTAALGDTLDAKVHLNPWVLSAGIAYRF
jgi:outer membrane protein